MPKGEFDGDLIPRRGSEVVCTQIPRSTIAKRAYLLCCDVELNVASFSTTARNLRRSAEVTRGFCGDTQLRGPGLVLKGLPDSTRIYFTYKLNFVLVQTPVRLRVCVVFKSQASFSSCRNPVVPGVPRGLRSFSPTHLGVHVVA